MLHIFLKTRRELASLSQSEVAKRLGYSTPQFISNWERSVSLPPPAAIKDLEAMYSLKRGELAEMIVKEKLRTIKKDLCLEYGVKVEV